MKLRIAMVGACPYPFPQGSQLLLRETARGLQAIGHDVRLVTYGYGADDFTDNDIPLRRADRIPGVTPPLNSGPNRWKPLLDAGLAWTLRRICREEAIDVIGAHNMEALLVALAVRKHPVLYFAHNAMEDELPYYCLTDPAQKRARRFGRWLDQTFPRRADRIIAPHRRLAGHFVLRGCDPARIAVIPPPVDSSLFSSDFPEPSSPPSVVYMGNQDAYQNLPLLFSAMDEVRKTFPQVLLKMFSMTPCDRPGVEYLPDTGMESLRKVLADEVIVAVPRISWSGYPMKILNAMAAGRPVVACASAAGPIENGVNGLLAPDNDPSAFAAALVRLIGDARLRRELGKNAREKVSHGHAPVTVAQSVERLALAALGRAEDSQEEPM